MTPTQFKAKYRTAIAHQFDKVKQPTPELLKAIIDLERMVSELKECSCGMAPTYPAGLPWPWETPRTPQQPWKIPEVWCRTGDRNGIG